MAKTKKNLDCVEVNNQPTVEANKETETKQQEVTTKQVKQKPELTQQEKQEKALAKMYIRYIQCSEALEKKDIHYYSKCNKEMFESYKNSLTEKQKDLIVRMYEIETDYFKHLNKYVQREYMLDKIYGKEHLNIMELTDEERDVINKRRAKQQEIKEARKEVK